MIHPISWLSWSTDLPRSESQSAAELELNSSSYDWKAQYTTIPERKKKKGFTNIIFKNICHSIRKGQSFEQELGKMDIHMQKNKVGSFPYTIFENELRMDQDVNVRAKTITFLRKHRTKFYDIRFDNNFLDISPKT